METSFFNDLIAKAAKPTVATATFRVHSDPASLIQPDALLDILGIDAEAMSSTATRTLHAFENDEEHDRYIFRWSDFKWKVTAFVQIQDIFDAAIMLRLSWNDEYEGMKRLIDERTIGKGEFLEQLRPIKVQMIALGDKKSRLFSHYENGNAAEDTLISQVQSWREVADRAYKESLDLPFAPPDCDRYVEACQNLFAIVHNMFVFFSKRWLQIWKKPNRDKLMKAAVKQYQEELETLAFEEKRIH